jgi:hypothetical protein
MMPTGVANEDDFSKTHHTWITNMVRDTVIAPPLLSFSKTLLPTFVVPIFFFLFFIFIIFINILDVCLGIDCREVVRE